VWLARLLSTRRPERGIREAQNRRGGRSDECLLKNYDRCSTSARSPSLGTEIGGTHHNPARKRARKGERVCNRKTKPCRSGRSPRVGPSAGPRTGSAESRNREGAIHSLGVSCLHRARNDNGGVVRRVREDVTGSRTSIATRATHVIHPLSSRAFAEMTAGAFELTARTRARDLASLCEQRTSPP
jgi:hypothetical protein